MKKILSVLPLLCSALLFAQPNTEVHLFDVINVNDTLQLQNGKNISNNEGYDNQPSFYNDSTLLFAATRNGQTDVIQYTIAGAKKKWLNNTQEGSEYSPLRIPEEAAFSAIRLDTNGLQRLYKYDVNTGKSSLLVKKLKIGYHLWYNKQLLVATVLTENRMDLVVIHTKNNTVKTYYKNVGRSLHNIPNSKLISFISKEKDNWEIKSLNPLSGETALIAKTLPKAEDMCWLKDGTILMGTGKDLMKYHPSKDKNWEVFKTFEDENINNITRLVSNSTSQKLAIVAEVSPADIVQKQVDTFNKKDLDGFVGCYTSDVLVRNFPNDTSYVGRPQMKKNYARFYKNNPNTTVSVLKRMVLGNKVIDHEEVTQNGKIYKQVAIYEVKNGLISSMTFIHPKKSDAAEPIVQKQLDAYNKKAIDAFIETFSEDVKVYDFPDKLAYSGTANMHQKYLNFFKNTPDLNATITARIVIGNKVIDKEHLTINGNTYHIIALYEVENGKIAKVTFIR